MLQTQKTNPGAPTTAANGAYRTAERTAIRRGFVIKHKLGSLYPQGKSSPANEAKAVRPGILIAVGLAFAFMFVTLLSSASESTNEIRRQLPALRERYAGYVATTHGNESQAVWEQRWPLLAERLEGIAHSSQQEDRQQVRVKVDALLALERDARSPVYQFALQLRNQLPPE